jgi:CO/xanthine dehydrogenase Mo-binding subunit
LAAPDTDQWRAGCTSTLQGGAALVAAKKLKAELFNRAASKLDIDAALLELKNGVVRVKANPQKSILAAELLGGTALRMHGDVKAVPGRSLSTGAGACFVEVEVDSWTGQFRISRVVYAHDVGKIINPFVAISDMEEGSFMQSLQIGPDAPQHHLSVVPDSHHHGISKRHNPSFRRKPRAALVLRI